MVILIKKICLKSKLNAKFIEMSEVSSEIALLEEETKNNPESPSNFCLTVTTQTSSSVILQWIYEKTEALAESTSEIVFKLLKLETRDEWKSIAWTRNRSCKIENLEQNVCYSLQLLVLVQDDDEFKVVDQSDVFKVEIFLVRY